MSFKNIEDAKDFLRIGEDAFDSAILDGSPAEARAIAEKHIVELAPLAERGIHLEGLSRFALKEIAIPLYDRAVHDEHDPAHETEGPDINGVFYDTTQYLAYLNQWRHDLINEGKQADRFDPLVGVLGREILEMTMFAIIARGMNGTPDDRLTILPATRAQAAFDKHAAPATNFAFVLRERLERKRRIKIATAYPPDERHYATDILVLNTEKIFSGRPFWLTTSLIDVSQTSQPGPYSMANLREAEPRLQRHIAKHLKDHGQPALTATNL